MGERRRGVIGEGRWRRRARGGAQKDARKKSTKFLTGAAFFAGGLPTARVAEREADARSNEAGAMATVPARRMHRTTSLILIYRSV